MGKKGIMSSFRKNKGEKYQVEAEPEEDNPLKEFFIQIEKMDTEIDELCTRLDEINSIQGQIMSNPRNNKEMKMSLDEKLTQMRKQMRVVKEQLKAFEQDNEESASSGLVTDTALRMRKMQFQKQTRKFLDFMERYQQSQLGYKELCKTRIQKQLKIAGVENVDGDRLEELVSSHDPQVFTQLMIRDTAEAKATLNDVQARHNDILKLEEGIREIHDLFIEIDTIVASQQEAFDRIENNVGDGVIRIVEATSNLHGAREKKKSLRKKKVCLAITGVIVVVVIIVILAISLG